MDYCGVVGNAQRCPSNPQFFRLTASSALQLVLSAVTMRPWRIGLYTAGTQVPLTTIDIHVSREPESCEGDQTTSGSQRTTNIAGRRPPHRHRGKLYPLSLTLDYGALGHYAMLEKAPERDCQLAGEPDNADFAAAHSGAGETFLPPGRQRTLRLVTQPGPSQLDERLPGELRPGFADSAIATDIAARIGARRQSDERGQMSPTLET